LEKIVVKKEFTPTQTIMEKRMGRKKMSCMDV